jgi:transglutaminase-like putative cysteine protease
MDKMKAGLTLLLCAAFCAAASDRLALGQKGAPPARALKFPDERVTLPFGFQRSGPDDPYLTRLREGYALAELVEGRKSDYEKVRAVSRWVRTRWEHNGSNMPEKPDPISILEEAKQGKRFRCVEYSAVLAAALNAVGVRARVLSLLTEDVETRESGAAHVVAEAYLADRKKWVMVDGQWDVIPTLKGKPLGAEFQRALAKREKGLGVDTFSGVKADGYFEWVAPYLFYFITKFDGRYGVAASRKELVLVPVGAREPKVVQRKWPIGDVVYTNSLRAFNDARR